MNFFDLHLGDWAQATSHLSIIEEGVYFRMIRRLYATERALPTEVKAIERLIGARSDIEREALANILDEFFGWMIPGGVTRDAIVSLLGINLARLTERPDGRMKPPDWYATAKSGQRCSSSLIKLASNCPGIRQC